MGQWPNPLLLDDIQRRLDHKVHVVNVLLQSAMALSDEYIHDLITIRAAKGLVQLVRETHDLLAQFCRLITPLIKEPLLYISSTEISIPV